MANKITSTVTGSTDPNFVGLPNNILDVYSQEILFAAQPNLRFEAVAVRKEDLTVSPGGTIRFLRYNALQGKSNISEDVSVETDNLSNTTFAISVTEHIRAIAVSQKMLLQSITSVMDDAAVILGMNYARNRDMVIRDAGYTVSATAFGNGDATRSAITNSAGDVMTVNIIQDNVETLAVNKAPKIGGDAYICFVHPRQSKLLRRDTAWINVVQYGDPSRIFNGEIGRIEDVRFIETTMVQVLKARTGTSGTFVSQVWTDNLQETTRAGVAIAYTNASQSGELASYGGKADTFLPAVDVYRALMVGENAIGLADALPVELRDNGVEDFGRKHSLGYYAIFGAGTIEPGHGVVIETAGATA